MKKLYTSPAKRNWLAPALGTFALGAALLAAPAAHAQVTSTTPKLEAENGTLAGGAVVATAITGFSGAGYVDYNSGANSVTFTYTAAAAGFYDIVIRYESQYDFKIGDLNVNGGPKSPVYFNSTKTGAAFRSTTPRRLMLTAGANLIRIGDGYNYYGIDYIQVAPSATNVTLTPDATTGRVEAEKGQLFAVQALVKDGDTSPYSGTGYVTSFSEVTAANSSLTLPVNVATAGLYQIAVGAREQFADKSFDLAVATGTSPGSKLTTMIGAKGVAPATTDFQSLTVGKYNLTAGTNTITITSQTGYIDIDYIDITATTGTPTAARASADAQKALAVYPNPANGQDLTVSLESATAQNATLELVNALGQRVLSTSRTLKTGGNQFQLATDHVAAGVYQLVVRSGDQPALSRRVMIAK